MKILITGSEGFIGKNLQLHLSVRENVEVICFTRKHLSANFPDMLNGVDFVFHLAGVNRPKHVDDFVVDNVDVTQVLSDAIASIACETGKKIPIAYASSIQAEYDNPYGASKRAAEDVLFNLQCSYGIPVYILRLPNVFGKWCKPNYNSAIATFCYNIARDLPIQVNDSSAAITLSYVDDVVQHLIQLLDGTGAAIDDKGFSVINYSYTTTVGDVVRLIKSFNDSRISLTSERVGTGFVRALYSTYVSYLPPQSFAYEVPMYEDSRGVFAEMLKTPDCGQFSYFTALPGITRGGHYHHSKTEKFLVIKGEARFRFRHMYTGETFELFTNGAKAKIVETTPGWTHDITNIGQHEMIVMLWANEVFNRQTPDTFTCAL